MANQKHPFQKWVEENDIVDIRFFPKNPTESSVADLLDSAHSAVQAYKNGTCYDYTDPVDNLELDTI